MKKVDLKKILIGLAAVSILVSTGCNNESGGKNWKWVEDPSTVTARVDDEKKLTPKEENGQWGYVDESGEWVVKPNFESAEEFSYGVGTLKLFHYSMWFNWKGEELAKPSFKMEGVFSGGSMSVKGVDSYSSKAGKLQKVKGFSEGYAAVLVEGKWGFLDNTGYFIIEPIFDEADNFVNGTARVTYQGKTGYIQLRLL
ncbi:MAG: WG repeat-containing protein [Dysgonamonadaceae bacterium]|jgi:hypothetical protein|nr:WG repeat-containing protein [Dysgonamonadaceae bacterium]